MRNKGFTLIEVIIVIVILGILAGLALPRIARQAEGAKAAEAINMLGTLKRAAIDCLDARGDSDFTNCNSATELGIVLPGGKNFFYTQSGNASPLTFTASKTVSGVNYCIAMKLTLDNTNGQVTIDVGANSEATNPYAASIRRSARTGNVWFTPTCAAADNI